MELQTLFRRTGVLLVAGSVALGLISTAVADDVEPGEVPALWKEQEIRFQYASSSGAYSCAAIEDKVRALLTDLGAAQGLRVKVHSCQDGLRKAGAGLRTGYRQDELMLEGIIDPIVTITIRSLVQDTPQSRSEAAASRGQEELKALLRNQGALDADYALPVAAEWKHVRLSGRTRYLDATDCELLAQLRRDVFVKLAVRVVRDSGTCQRRSVSPRLGAPNLHVEALVPVRRDVAASHPPLTTG